MHHLFFVNRYFFPDESATSQLLADLVFSLADSGVEITVIASRQLVDDRTAQLEAHARVRGVTVRRVWTTSFGRGNLAGRFFDFITFYLTACMILLRLAKPGDVIVSKTDPPFIGLVGEFVSMLKGTRTINWWQDVYPEIAERLGVPGFRLAGPIMRSVRNLAARGADLNVAIGRCMREHLTRCGIDDDRIVIIPNWVDEQAIRPLPAATNVLRTTWGLDDFVVVGYSGNIGRGHDFDLLLTAAQRLQSNPAVRFLFIGSGARRAEVESEVARHGLDNVDFRPFQPRENLPESLTVPDVHIVTLRSDLCGLIVPSKFYGALAAGRPVIFIGPARSEIARVLLDWECGFVCAPDDTDGLTSVIDRLAADTALREQYGRRAREAAVGQFGRAQALAAWRDVVRTALELPAGDSP